MESLPNEILEKIFDFLPRRSLESLLRACVKFLDVIAGSSKLMQKIPVEISKTSDFKRLSNQNTLHEGLIRELWTHGTIPKEQIEKYGQTQTLILSETTKENFQSNFNLLDNLSKVVIKTSIKDTSEENIVLNKKVLDEVEMKYVHAPFFDDNVQIKKLLINYYFCLSPNSRPDSTSKLILAQTMLTSLTIHHLNCFLQGTNGLFKEDLSDKIQFRLKHLEMSYHSPVKNSMENMCKFLKKQQDLRSLSLNGPISPEMWQIIVELPMLEKLELSEKCFDNFSFSDKLTKNGKVVELTLSGKFSNETFEKLLRHFPRVVKFVQKDDFKMSQDHIKTLAGLLPNLQTLAVRIFDFDVNFEKHVFKELKILTIDALRLYQNFHGNWQNFVTMFPSIERLSIFQGVPNYTFSDDVMDIFLNGLKMLQVLEIGPSFVDFQVLEHISKHPDNSLKVLKCGSNDNITPEDLQILFGKINILVFLMNDDYFDIEGNDDNQMLYELDPNWEYYFSSDDSFDHNAHSNDYGDYYSSD